MITPRTVEEIADAILPASIDGLHERALCLLLAEHERSFHELENRCRLLESRSYAANERLDALDRCEPGEEGREEAASPSAAASDQRAPGSTAPTTEDANYLASLLDGITGLENVAYVFRALAADRDRLARERDGAIQLMESETRELRLEKFDRQKDREDATAEWAEMRFQRDALARRIEAMARREPTEAELQRLIEMRCSIGQYGGSTSTDLWRYVRDAILATPKPEPLSEPRCGLATASEPSPIHEATKLAVKDVDILLRQGAALGKEARERFDALKPAPATPSDEGCDDAVRWLRDALNIERHENEAIRRDLAEARAQLDPERERLIAELMGAWAKDMPHTNKMARLAAYERKRRGES